MSADEIIIHTLFENLEHNGNLALKNSTELAQTDFRPIRERVQQSGGVFNRYRRIFENQKSLNDYVQAHQPFNLNQDDVMTIFSSFLIQYSLDYIEVTKLFFIENLDPNSTLYGKQVSKIKTLGILVHHLKNQFNMPELLSLFPFEFRNVLGHGSYWWNTRHELSYNDKNGIERNVSFANFMNIMGIFDKTFTLIFREYMARI